MIWELKISLLDSFKNTKKMLGCSEVFVKKDKLKDIKTHFLLKVCFKVLYYTFPFLESSIDTHFVVSNLAHTIFIIAISGTARNAPTSHHILDQNTRAISIIKLLRLSLFPIIFGSKTFHDIN